MAERYIFGGTVTIEAYLDSPGEIEEAIALLEDVRGGTYYYFSGEIREELEHIRGFMTGEFEEALKEIDQ